MDTTKIDSKVSFEQVQVVQKVVVDSCRTRHAVFSECPHCGSALHAEHAHFKCSGCGWRDSCCD
ncbi:MAG TPA: hypothetical protein DEO42_01480 [Acidimicrobium sp.]|nr:MAG: hypothetical protein ABR56_09345 [Acidimicrobium sp. BACL27 MAG-120823-bin4]KRO43481.1 MAG: hypothetical protein ABR56_01005 [Acidimicrobium sp. BACL27 MAG-120823-bin4]HBZ61467.1 hypothetical protein [Acidimicrobium sp.]